jgi:hypothetical protein
MTSRREFLSNAFGIALASATTWPIRADQARSTQGQSNTGASKSGRTAQKTTLGWDVFLAPSIPAITSDLPPGKNSGHGRRFRQPLFPGSGTLSWSTPHYRRAGASSGELGYGEPLPAQHPFRSMDNALATPHIGYVSESLYRTFYGDSVASITAWLDRQDG